MICRASIADDSIQNKNISRKIIVKGDHLYPPFEFINEKGEPDGFNIELFKELAKELNLDFQLSLEPWAQIRKELDKGQIDMITGMSITPERAQNLNFTVPHSLMIQSIFIRRESKIKSLDDLKGKEIIVQDKDIMHDYLLKTKLTNHIIVVPDQLSALTLLSNGKHDAILMGSFQGAYFLNKYKFRNIRYIESGIEPQKYALATKKGNDELRLLLNSGLFQLKTNGTYDKLYNKWFRVYEKDSQYKKLRPYIYILIISILILIIFLYLLKTQIKKTVRRLTASEKRFNSISDLSPIGMGIIKNDKFIEVSPRFCQITGYSPEDLKDQHTNILNFSKTDSQNLFKNLWIQVKEKGYGSIEGNLRKKDNTNIPVIITSKLLDTESDSGFDSYIFTCNDLTSLKKTEQEINLANERLRIQIENSPLAVIETDENLKIKTWSPKAESFFGWTKEEVVGKNIQEIPIIESSQQARIENILNKQKSGTQKHNISINKNYAKDGSIVHCEWYNSALYNEQGEFISLLSIVNNVTELKSAERKNKEDQERLNWTIDATNLGVWEWNIQTGEIKINENYASILGYEKHELIKHLDTWRSLTHPDDIKKCNNLLERHFKDPKVTYEIETRMKHKNGHWVTILSRGKLISYTQQGEPLSMLGTHTDISIIKQVQKQLEQNEIRLNSMVSFMQKASTNIKDILYFALKEALSLTESKIGYLYTYNEKKSKLEMELYSTDLSNKYPIKSIHNIKLEKDGIWAEAIRKRKPIVINEYKEIDKYPNLRVPIKNFLSIPVISNKEIVMVIGIANKETDYNNSDILQVTILLETIWSMIEKKKADTQLKKLSVATKQSPASVIITDIYGKIEFANDKFIATSGYRFEELEGHILRVLRPTHTPEPVYSELWNTIKSGKNWKGQHQNSRKTGELYWESVIISPIRNEYDEITNYVIVAEDITKEKKLQLELLAAKEKAEESDKLKTAFLNNLSHEVRTPLNAIVGFSELMADESLPAEKRTVYSKTILKSSTQLLSLIENIINISIIESGQVKFNNTKISINQLLNDVYNQVLITSPKKEITLRVNSMISRVNDEVIIDQTKLVQILFNLLENAFKYTKSGIIQFGCKVENDNLVFHVEDTGVGFPKEKRNLLFERFRQGNNSLTGLNNGMGIGLSISKSYIDLLGGSIKIDSSDKGTRIEFTLPYTPVKPLMNQADNTTPKSIKANSSILVVDDVEINHLIIVEMLNKYNLTIYYAKNGKESIEMIVAHPEISLVLMDMKMPVMDGFTATAEIKKIKPNLPIIAQTAYALPADKQKAIKAGCDHYITKPIKVDELIEVIIKHLT